MPIPNPEPGLVISYAYLRHREHQAGREEGDKRTGRASSSWRSGAKRTARPLSRCCRSRTALRPIRPRPSQIPLPVKRHLGLDDDRSWIVVAEGNEFLWPGYDLRKLPHSDRYDYGFLPPRFFNHVLESFVACHQAGKRRFTPRE
jgi:hypothetical protein